ncbi:ComEC/Rec2 family competence protein [Bacteroidota bacterium]
MYKSIHLKLRTIPLVRFLLPLIPGIYIGLKSGITRVIGYNSALFLLLGLLLAVIINFLIGRNYKYSWIYGLFIGIYLSMSGFFLTHQKYKIAVFNSPVYLSGIAEITLEPEVKTKTYQTIIKIKKASIDSLTGFKVLSYFPKDSILKGLKTGQYIFFSAYINLISDKGNPFEFKYGEYLSRQGIFYQTYLQKGDFRIIKGIQNRKLIYKVSEIRQKLISVFKKYGLDGEELSVASALTLGYKEYLDTEIKLAYSASGAMHILAVSGLHIGIIYIVFNSLLKFLDRKSIGKVLRILILLIIIWFYALLTGLAPSVKRAAFMFSLLIIGFSSKKKINIYNSLAASAFFLLLFNPYLITSVGFQLSYAAVFSIVYFQKSIYRLISIKNRYIDKIWSLISVSIAVQLLTFPITIYYFNQFPNYFLITNIVAIPGAFLVLFSGIFVFISSFLPGICEVFVKVLEFIVQALNHSIFFINQLPYSHSSNLRIYLPEVFVLILLILMIAEFFKTGSHKYFQFILFMLICIISLRIYTEYENSKLRFYVYNIRGKSVYNFLSSSENVLISDLNREKDQKNFEYGIYNNFLHVGNIDPLIYRFNNLPSFAKKISSNSESFVIYYKQRRILVLRDNELKNYFTLKRQYLDYIILSNNASVCIQDLVELFIIGKVIIDSSNRFYRIENWVKECKELGIDCFNIDSMGAFSIEL